MLLMDACFYEARPSWGADFVNILHQVFFKLPDEDIGWNVVNRGQASTLLKHMLVDRFAKRFMHRGF
jgi:hypothetical protein